MPNDDSSKAQTEKAIKIIMLKIGVKNSPFYSEIFLAFIGDANLNHNISWLMSCF